MTCVDHTRHIEGCMACEGKWDRAEAERILREDLLGYEAGAMRMALAEIDKFYGYWVTLSQTRAADLDEAAATYEAMRAEIEALRRQVLAAEAWGRNEVQRANDTGDHVIAELRAEIEALHRCHDLDAFADGELDEAHADAFRLHLGTCERCAAKLEGRIHEHVATHVERP